MIIKINKKILVLFLLLIFIFGIDISFSQTENPTTEINIIKDKAGAIVTDSNFTLKWELEKTGLVPKSDSKVKLIGSVIPTKDFTIDFGIISPVTFKSGTFIVKYDLPVTYKIEKSSFCDSSVYGWEVVNEIVYCSRTQTSNISAVTHTDKYYVTSENYIVTNPNNATIYWNETNIVIENKEIDLIDRHKYYNYETDYGNHVYLVEGLNIKKDIEYNFEIILEVDKKNLPLKYTVALGDLSERKLWFLYDPEITDARTWTDNNDFNNGTTKTTLDITSTEIKLNDYLDLTQDMWAYWDLNETSSNFIDSQGSTNLSSYVVNARGIDFVDSLNPGIHLEANDSGSGLIWTTGDGSADERGTNDEFSINAWINTETNVGNIADKCHFSSTWSREFCWDFDASNHLTFDAYATSDTGGGATVSLAQTGSGITPGNHMVTMTYDDVNLKMYVDGVENLTTAYSSGIQDDSSGESYYIGAKWSNAGEFDGNMSDVAMWSRGISASEVTTLYNEGMGFNPLQDEVSGNYSSSGLFSDRQGWSPEAGNTITNISIVIDLEADTEVLFRYSPDNSTLESESWINLLIDGENKVTLSDMSTGQNIYYQFNLTTTTNGNTPHILSYTMTEQQKIPPKIFNETWNATTPNNNDTIKANVNVTSATGVDTVKYYVTFPNTTIKNYTMTRLGGTGSEEINNLDFETFTTNLGDWSSTGSTGCDWNQDIDGTQSSNTGPCGGVSNCPGDNAGYDDNVYVYVETSNNYCDGSTDHAYLTYANINFTKYDNIKVDYAVSMYGSQVGKITLEVEDGVGGWDVLQTYTGNKGTDWIFNQTNITGYSEILDIRFHYYRNSISGFYGDVAVDVLNITGIISSTPSLNRWEHNFTDSSQSGTYTWSQTWANDTQGNVNTTSPNKQFTIAGAEDSCTCTDGQDWAITMTDNCVLETDCNTLPGTVTFTGAGELKIKAELVSNFTMLGNLDVSNQKIAIFPGAGGKLALKP